jgi:hypothetical protein
LKYTILPSHIGTLVVGGKTRGVFGIPGSPWLTSGEQFLGLLVSWAPPCCCIARFIWGMVFGPFDLLGSSALLHRTVLKPAFCLARKVQSNRTFPAGLTCSFLSWPLAMQLCTWTNLSSLFLKLLHTPSLLINITIFRIKISCIRKICLSMI